MGKEQKNMPESLLLKPKDPLLADVIVSLCEQAGLVKEQIDVNAIKRANTKP
jgi:hypothetical protein